VSGIRVTRQQPEQLYSAASALQGRINVGFRGGFLALSSPYLQKTFLLVLKV